MSQMIIGRVIFLGTSVELTHTNDYVYQPLLLLQGPFPPWPEMRSPVRTFCFSFDQSRPCFGIFRNPAVIRQRLIQLANKHHYLLVFPLFDSLLHRL